MCLFFRERETVGGGAEGEEGAVCALSVEPGVGLNHRTEIGPELKPRVHG